MSTAVPQLLSARRASMLTGVPWIDLRKDLERAGFRVVRCAGRERVAEQDLVALIERGRQPTGAEAAARVDLALEMAMEEMGVTRRRRTRRATP